MHFLFLAYLSFTLRTVCNKEYTRRFSKTETNLFFNAIGLSITCLISALGGGILAPGSLVLGLAAVFGIIFVATVYLMLVSYSKGPMGLVALIFNLSSIVPVIAGLTIFHESLGLYKALGLLCVLCVFLLSWRDKAAKDREGKLMEYIPPKVWLPIALLTMLLNGSLSTIQNMTVQWAPDTSIMVFNFWAFLIGASLCWILLFIHKLRGGHFEEVTSQPKAFALDSTLCGLFASAGNILIMYALQYVPSTIAYPLNGSAGTITLYLISVLYYKEGRTRYGILMLAIGVLSIVLLGIA